MRGASAECTRIRPATKPALAYATLAYATLAYATLAYATLAYATLAYAAPAATGRRACQTTSASHASQSWHCHSIGTGSPK